MPERKRFFSMDLFPNLISMTRMTWVDQQKDKYARSRKTRNIPSEQCNDF